ncbi:hypothetical protein Psuf_000390 [Phytohabitans suffuscus]|uniref:FAD-binding domain-containing protein n=1 Tax=Phytohabitans suffuscus TaxID=624315 RepID=A0A6F8Y9E7_9ACTN|nr:hypothetical protein Psuf_000390 [Phytohabitans suffuscus]
MGRATVIERDFLAETPRHRKGLPQGRHTHLLWSGGVRILETLLPGVTDKLLAAGARKISMYSDMITLTSHGWQHRFPGDQFAVMCSRPLLDLVVRNEILATGRIDLKQGHEAIALTGDARRVTGVRVRTLDSGERSAVEADVVVDATGRGSRLSSWMAELGAPPVGQDLVDVGIQYATRIFRAPPGATTGFPAVNLLADHRDRQPGCNGALYPIEDGRWIVTLSGTRGAKVPAREEDFLRFAEELRSPLVADLIRTAEPLTPLYSTHTGTDRRLYPERMRHWPEGLLLFGDSLAAFNPIYGHGLTSAARAAATLDSQLQQGGLDEWSSRRAQQAICEGVDDPWIMAASRDICYVDCRNFATDVRLTSLAPALQRFAEAIAAKAIRAAGVAEMVANVASLTTPQSELGTSEFLSLLQRDRMLPELTEPPLRADELALANLDPSAPRPLV